MTAAQMFLRRMLWRMGEMLDRAEAVVALLGPPGTGKSRALATLAEQGGGTVVHASVDFADQVLQDPVVAVAFVALTLSDTWSTLRRPPTFHRVGLTLLALNENLSDGVTPNALWELVRHYVLQSRAERAAQPVPGSARPLAATLKGIAAAPKDGDDGRTARRAAIATLLADTVGWRGRLPTRRVPELDGAAMLSSLVAVSRTRRNDALGYLMRALLADIQDNAARLSIPPARCRCLIPDGVGSHRQHQHAWLLLVDNIGGTHGDAGRRFLAELIRARHARATGSTDRRPESDPLLVVAAVDEWSYAWAQWWCEPWRTEAQSPDRQRIPLFGAATRDRWLRHTSAVGDPNVARGANTAYGWYPVWLDPLDDDDVEALGPQMAKDVDVAAVGDFIRRLSGAWPAALLAIRDLYVNRPLESGGGRDPVPRSVLRAAGDRDGTPLWERAVEQCLPGALPLQRPWPAAPAVVAVTAHLSEPERATDDLDPDLFPDAAQALRRLRTELWISTFHARPSRLWAVAHGDAEHPAAVHPWLARCLFTGLATESDAAGPVDDTKMLLWEKLFTDLATTAGPIRGAADRTLFHDLACDKLDVVVRMLAARFDSDEHRSWIGLLDHVTSAPCPWPDKEPTARTVKRLTVDDDPHRTPVEAAVRNLVVLLWLYRDPLTVQEERWNKPIRDSLQRLINMSRRADVTALDEAAAQFD